MLPHTDAHPHSDEQIDNKDRSNNSHLNTDKEESGWMKWIHVAHLTCEYASTGILTIFMIEIVLKLVVDLERFKQWLEIMDAVIITSTFCLNLYLIIEKVEIHSVASLLTILRYDRYFCYFQR